MKPVVKIFLLVCLLLTPVLGQARMSEASQALPEPPATNPHPPVTEQDKQRVAFAEMVLHNILMRKLPPNPPEHEPNEKAAADVPPQLPDVEDPGLRLQLDESCLQKPACWSDNTKVRGYIAGIQNKLGVLTEIRHTHIIPWSIQNFLQHQSGTTYQVPSKTAKPHMSDDMGVTKAGPDEYVFHAYGRFDKTGMWYHVDVIVTEDAQGKIKFQRFYIIQMPMYNDSLPPGAVC